MSISTLSAIPYYGGKSKMNDFICDMLDYKQTSIYIEPFAGGARTLLNKPKHQVEYINDLNRGICALFDTLSKEDTALQLINHLYETSCNEEWFHWALEYRNSIEDNYNQELNRQLYSYIKEVQMKYNFDLYDSYFNSKGKDEIIKNKLSYIKLDNKDIVRGRILLDKYYMVHGKDYNPSMSLNEVTDKKDYDKIKLAKATFIVYQLSRDAMGKDFSPTRFKSDDAYYKKVDRLVDVMHRLKGVNVISKDCFELFSDEALLDRDDIMIYADPTYLKEKDVTDYKKKVLNKKKEYNPGSIYKHFWTYEEHELFLSLIQNTKCKILVSNYRDSTCLYDKYLNADYGWRSIEFETKTTVAGLGKERTEVLWYNY